MPNAVFVFYGGPFTIGRAGSIFGASAFPILGGGRSERNMVMVLESMVGAIIGKAGANAKEITKLSGCKLHIETRDEKADRETGQTVVKRSVSGDDGERGACRAGVWASLAASDPSHGTSCCSVFDLIPPRFWCATANPSPVHACAQVFPMSE